MYPLVTIRVLTYNSSNTILETLDSIYAQTYPNIELVISDDCSKDNTVKVCQNWIANHGSRFERIKLITSKVNTGIAENCNRAENECRGEWVKGIAGDDILFPNAIEKYVEFINKHPESVYIFSRVECFGGSYERMKFVEDRHIYDFFSWDIDKQLDFLIFQWNCIPTVTNFYNRCKVLELGITNDKRIPLLEDHPKWINVLKKGVKLYFIDEPLVKYRVSDNAVSTQIRFSKMYQKSMAKMFKYYQADEYIKKYGIIYTINHYIEIRTLWSNQACLWLILSKVSKYLLKITNKIKKCIN